jgi:hypothetical protein
MVRRVCVVAEAGGFVFAYVQSGRISWGWLVGRRDLVASALLV